MVFFFLLLFPLIIAVRCTLDSMLCLFVNYHQVL